MTTKAKKTDNNNDKLMGVIDETWTEIDLSDFLADNPDLIKNLKEKYGV
jgi:hypothetical protein